MFGGISILLGARKSEAEAIPVVVVVVVVVVLCRCRCRRGPAFNQEAPVTFQHVTGICSKIPYLPSSCLVAWHLRHPGLERIVYSEEALWGIMDMLPFPALS
jgi:hypothetical protein